MNHTVSTSLTHRSAAVPEPQEKANWPPWWAPEDVYERVKPVFKHWASLVVHAGEPGMGTRMKLARNMLTFTAFAAACEAMQLAERSGWTQTLGRVVRHTDALTGGPGVIMIRDNMHDLDPGHWL